MAQKPVPVSTANIEPSIIDRISGAVQFTITGEEGGESWFGPRQPIRPVAQEVQGRAWDFPTGYNQYIRPRINEGISFQQLRALADNLDILRLVIETRKDQIEAFEWGIIPIDEETKGKPDQAVEAETKAVKEFLLNPSTEHGDFATWIRVILEDLFVIDAICIYPRFTADGQDLYSLDVIDAALIKRNIDDQGRTPIPPDPAYQQILHGLPAVDYHADELIYMMRNPRSNKVYGFGPVEQIIMTINIALRRQVFTLSYYTEGNIPEALASLPETWSVDQVRAFQDYFDALFTGDLASRRRIKFGPFDSSKIKEMKDPSLKDEFDEWLARIVCYCFSISPTPFIRELNRSTGESSAGAAKEEGLLPLLNWIERKINFTLSKYANVTKVKFKFKVEEVVSPSEQATIDDTYVSRGIWNIDDVLERQGKEKLGLPNMVFLTSGPVPFDVAMKTAEANLKTAENPPAPAAIGGLGGAGKPKGGVVQPKGKPTPQNAAKKPAAKPPAKKLLDGGPALQIKKPMHYESSQNG